MAGRWERLALEAHCRRAIDFTDSGPYQRVKEEVIFGHLEDQLAADVMELAHDWHASAAASDPWDTDGKTFDFHRKECNKIYRSVGKLKLPWYKRWTLDDADTLIRLIRQFYAQEKDPKFREWRDGIKKEMRDKIDKIKQDQQAVRDISEAMKKTQGEREKRAKQAHERRKARARSPVRS